MSTASQSLLFVERVCQTQPEISNGLLGIGIHTNQLSFFHYLWWFFVTRKKLAEHLIGEIDRAHLVGSGTSAG